MDHELKQEIIIDNYNNPFHKNHDNVDKYIKVNTNSESCIDNVDIYVLFDGNKIKDIKFDGEACAISTSSTSIMLRKIIGKTIDEVKEIINNYDNMINEKEYNSNLLEELNVYDEIYLKPNRKNCALLPSNAIRRAIEIYEVKNDN